MTALGKVFLPKRMQKYTFYFIVQKRIYFVKNQYVGFSKSGMKADGVFSIKK